MANFQTLTQINNLIKKLEILKSEKEGLRVRLKNTKLESAQNLWKHKQNVRAQNSQIQKSITHKQGLLLFAETEQDLELKLEKIYKPQIELFLPKVLQVITDEILTKNSVKESSKTQSANYQIICSPSLNYLLGNQKVEKTPKNSTLEILQFNFTTKIYILQPEKVVQDILKKIITKNLDKIARIRLAKEDSETEEGTENRTEDQMESQNKIKNSQKVEEENQNSLEKDLQDLRLPESLTENLENSKDSLENSKT